MNTTLVDWKFKGILAIPIIYFTICLILSYFHSTFEEWDGVIQCFQGNEIFNGSGYKNYGSHYWPPLFSVLVGLLSSFTSGMFAARFISILASALTLVVVFAIIKEFTNDNRIALISQILIALNPYYFISSIQAENHMLDTFFFIIAFFFIVKVVKFPDRKVNIILLAGSTAFATLSRYTSYALIPLILIVFIFFTKRKYFFGNFIVFSFTFFLINFPWYYYNFLNNGNPLHTWQYLNIGSYIYPGGVREWQWFGQTDYFTTGQVISDFPKEYIANFIKNVIDGCIQLLRATKIIIIFCILLIISQRKNITIHSFKPFFMNPFIQIVLLGFLGFLFLVSQAFVFMEVFLSWNVLITILLLLTTINLIDVNKIGKPQIFVLLFLLLLNIGYTGVHVSEYLFNKDDSGQLVDHKEITDILKKEKNITNSYIMCTHPARAYYINSHYLMLPEYFKGDVGQLVNYDGLSDKVKTTQPKYPNVRNLDIHADYLILETFSRKMLPQFEFLFEESDPRIPNNFKLLYKSSNAVVYKIIN